MSRCFTSALVVLISLLATADAFGLGSDFSKEELSRNGELVKGQTPVHGYWVNWEDMFFYSGDTGELNRFLESYAKMTGHTRRVVIHAGGKKARSPWDMTDRDIPTDWSFYRWNTGSAENAKPAPSRVDIWIGTRIKLDELQVPAGIEVTSGGEIERFVERRQKQAAKVVAPDEAIKLGTKDFVSVEFNVASATWTLAPRPPGQPSGPVILEMGEKLKNGGRFYVMLWGEAVGPSEDARTKEFKDKRVRATGRIQVSNQESASTDYYMTIYETADIEAVTK